MASFSVPGCGEMAGGRAGCLCRKHRKKRERMGHSYMASRPPCRVPDCDRPVACVRDGTCMTHYQRERRRRLAHGTE